MSTGFKKRSLTINEHLHMFECVVRKDEPVAQVAERYCVDKSVVYAAMGAVRRKDPAFDAEYKAKFPARFGRENAVTEPQRKTKYCSAGVLKLATMYSNGRITRDEMVQRMKDHHYE